MRLKEEKELREKQILDIYAAYPKKVGKGQALKAIGTALSKCSFDTLLDHVKKIRFVSSRERSSVYPVSCDMV
jgi:hypothetical protein